MLKDRATAADSLNLAALEPEVAQSGYPELSKPKLLMEVQTPFGINRFILLTVVTIYVICVGSHFFNWTPWEEILIENGAFNSLCETKAVCREQEMRIASLLPLASLMMFTFTFLAGLVLDIIGPKVCCLLGNTLLILGWCLLAVASEARYTYAVGFALMGAGTDPAFFGTLSIANLFPGYNSTVISILGGARSVSNCLPFILQLVSHHSPGFTLQWMCISILILYSFCVLCVIFLIPFKPYEVTAAFSPISAPSESSSAAAAKLELATTTTTTMMDPPLSNKGVGTSVVDLENDLKEASSNNKNDLTLLGQLKSLKRGILSPLYYPIIFINVVNMIRNNFYLTSASKQLGKASDILTIINLLAFIPGPILGFIVDKFGPLKVILGLNSTNLISYVLLLLGQIVQNASSSFGLNVASVMFAFPGIGFLLSQMYCYVSVVFDPQDMGKLAGLASLLAGVCGLIVNPMYDWSRYNDSFWQMDLVLIVFTLCSYAVIGVLMWLLARHHRRK